MKNERTPLIPTIERASATRIWLLPLLLLGSAGLSLFLLTYMADALASQDPLHVLLLIFHPNPEAAANTLANAGEIVAAVLAIALTVVAITVELASNRYTHRITELFITEPVNFAIMSLFVVTALQGMWVSVTFDQQGGFVPYYGIAVTMWLLTLCLLVLLPYFNFVFKYLNPLQIVRRISAHTLSAIQEGKGGTLAAQREAVRGVEQLADVALNSLAHRDKTVAMASMNALCKLVSDYQAIRDRLPPSWFELHPPLTENPDFVSMDPHTLGLIAERRTWFEMKVLRQYQTIFGESLNRVRDLNYVVAINTRQLAEEAMARNQLHLLHLLMQFFNTYVRAAINARDVRTAYNVFNQYRRLAEALVAHGLEAHLVETVRYFKYYGLLAFQARLAFILETVAYDLCTLIELAAERELTGIETLLSVFLQVDKESEGEVQEAALRGVRKAQVKLATFFLARGDTPLARRVYNDMAGEEMRRLSSIREELLAVRSPEYWEITDRGANFDYISPDRKHLLIEFFSWFPNLPEVQLKELQAQPAAPGANLDEAL